MMLRALLLLCWLTVPLSAQSVPEAVRQEYLSLTQAWVRLDSEAVLQHFTPTAQLLDGRGLLLDREGLERTVLEAMLGAQHCQISYQILSAEKREDELVVRTHQERVIDYGNRLATRIAEREDSWQETPEGWKITYVRFITQSATVESRAVRPPRR